jgi:hypothetical protein
MSEDLDHASNEHKDILLLKVLLSLPEVSLEISEALLHLNVPLFERVDIPLLLLEEVASAILDDIGVRIRLDFAE